MSTINQHQQGDVALTSVEVSWPIKSAYENRKKVQSVILAEGEQTGHNHVLEAFTLNVATQERVPAFVELFSYQGTDYVVVPEKTIAVVTHQEHEPISVPPGIYRNDGILEQDALDDRVNRVVD